MMQRIIRDYFAAFHWRKLREACKDGGWLFLYFLFLLPVIWGVFDTAESAITYFCVAVPLMFCLFAAKLHPMVLPKLMYLCPISKENRKRYIKNYCYFCMIVPIVLGALGAIGLVVSGIYDWVWAGTVILNVTLFSVFLGSGIGSGVSEEGKGAILNNLKAEVVFTSARAVIEICMVLLVLINGLLFCLVSWEHWGLAWVKWIFLGMILLVELPLTIAYLRYFSEAVERAVYYEKNYVNNK